MNEKTIDTNLALKIAKTCDILLYANDLKHREKRVRWQKIIVAGGGNATVERRLPIIHSAIVIKDPPQEIRDIYGLKSADGNVFVFEASSASKDGARLVSLQKWVAYELDPSCPGGRCILRTRDPGVQFTPPPELWEWLKVARNIPYSALNSEALFNGFFIEGAYASVIRAASDIAMDNMADAMGDGPISRMLQGLAGLAAQLMMLLIFVFNFVYTVVFYYIPHVIRQRKIKN
jgi:hypothetical protein